ncbi:MAG: IS110 family transposase, partial [Limisphaerales bacterium]
LEQPAVHLISFLEAYAWITLHPINPITLQKYREAFVTSRAKDDTKDADYLADLLLNHHAKLPVWSPDDSPTRTLQQLVFHRGAVVDERTALTNFHDEGGSFVKTNSISPRPPGGWRQPHPTTR